MDDLTHQVLSVRIKGSRFILLDRLLDNTKTRDFRLSTLLMFTGGSTLIFSSPFMEEVSSC